MRHLPRAKNVRTGDITNWRSGTWRTLLAWDAGGHMPFKECTIVDDREELLSGADAGSERAGSVPRVEDWLGDGTPSLGFGPLCPRRASGLCDRSTRPLPGPDGAVQAGGSGVGGAPRASGLGWATEWRVLRDDGLARSRRPLADHRRILRRHGRLDGPGAGEARAWRRFEHAAPNDLWQMDFKGHFALGRGRCHPLTVLDDHSRYALEIGACADERGETVRARLEVFVAPMASHCRILAEQQLPWAAPGSDQRHAQGSPSGCWTWGVGIIHGPPPITLLDLRARTRHAATAP